MASPDESALWLYEFVASARRGDVEVNPHVIELVEAVLARYEDAVIKKEIAAAFALGPEYRP